MQVKKPTTKTKSHGNKRIFVVGLSLSTPARVQATLLSPTGKKLRSLRTQLSAGRHSLSFVFPSASLPPGRYTILVVATGSDGSKITKRVYVKVSRKHKAATKRAPGKTKTRSVAIPVAPPAPPSGSSSDAPSTPNTPSSPTPTNTGTNKPVTKAPASPPKASPLQTASGYASSKPRRTAGFLIVLLGMGAAIAFLIKIEMGRMLASPARR
jgi:hypothetical protein